MLMYSFNKQCAEEFRKSIINDNKLTRGDAHLTCCVKQIKNFDREIQNGGWLKIADFEIIVQNFNTIAYKNELSQIVQQHRDREYVFK